jgi:hypothetical protein
LGKRLADMLDWCREHVTAGWWNHHGRSERCKGEAPAHFARFYFMSEGDAAAFRLRWDRRPMAHKKTAETVAASRRQRQRAL